MTIEAKPTRYHNQWFRSQLEARWALLFTELGVDWAYEPQTYTIRDMKTDGETTFEYLPDFYLPNQNLYVEVKGDPQRLDLYDLQSAAVSLPGITPAPQVGDCCLACRDIADQVPFTGGLLIVGDIPRPSHMSPSCNFALSLLVPQSGAVAHRYILPVSDDQFTRNGNRFDANSWCCYLYLPWEMTSFWPYQWDELTNHDNPEDLITQLWPRWTHQEWSPADLLHPFQPGVHIPNDAASSWAQQRPTGWGARTSRQYLAALDSAFNGYFPDQTLPGYRPELHRSRLRSEFYRGLMRP